MSLKTKLYRAGQFVLRIYVPPDKDFWVARQALKADLAWQPYLYTAVFWGALLTIAFGDEDTLPIEHIDKAWIFFGLLAPVVGFISSMMLKLGRGQARYAAFWLRIASNVGLMSAISIYLIAVIKHPSPMTITMYLACMLFLLVLLVKDSHFLIVTEQIAKKLRDDGQL